MPLPSRLGLTVACLASVAGGASAQLPPLPVPTENPITEAKRVLGKLLFWEEQLSSDNTVACGTCHIPGSASSDPRQGAHPGPDGLFGTADDTIGSPGVIRADVNDEYTPSVLFGLDPQVTPRATPSVIGSQWADEIFWDGRAGSVFINPQTGDVSISSGGALENQVVGPPLSAVEMAHEVRDWGSVTSKLKSAQPMALASNLPADVAAAISGGKTYPDLFSDAFGDVAITAERIAFAVATYERTLIPDQTPYDLGSMTPAQQQGYTMLRDHTVCFNCHTEPLFTDNEFYNIGLRPSDEDLGRFIVTGDPSDRGTFKTPTLRNVLLKPSLMHVGWITDTQDALDFYNANTQNTGHVQFTADQSAIPPGGGVYANINLPPQFQPNVIDFIENALLDPRVVTEVFPFDRPILHSEQVPLNPNLIGTGAPGSGGLVPEMIANRPPNLGNGSFLIGVRNGLGGAGAFLAASLTPPGPSGLVAGFMHARPMTLAGAGSGAGYGTFRLRIPADPVFAGREVYLQWFVLDPGAGGGLATSEVAHATLF
jgi:cytochrome c peroxidase